MAILKALSLEKPAVWGFKDKDSEYNKRTERNERRVRWLLPGQETQGTVRSLFFWPRGPTAVLPPLYRGGETLSPLHREKFCLLFIEETLSSLHREGAASPL